MKRKTYNKNREYMPGFKQKPLKKNWEIWLKRKVKTMIGEIENKTDSHTKE